MLALPLTLLLCWLPARPQNNQPPPATPAQDGQVATGARASARPTIPLRQLLEEHDWIALEAALANTADPDANFYRGLLLNRQGHYAESIALLKPLIPTLAAAPDRTREKQARLALADDEFRSFHYAQAAEQYAALRRCCAAQLAPSEVFDTEAPARLVSDFASAPAQTLDLHGSFTVPTDRDPLGLTEVSVWVDGRAASWLFNPAANFTLLTRSLAARLGLRLSANPVSLTTITGQPIEVRATVIPQLHFGEAFYRNVPAVVCEDADLYDKARDYQIEGVLAQPLLAPLGQVTVSDDEHVTFSREAPPQPGAPFYSDGQHLIVAEGPAGVDRLYVLDPGGLHSQLTVRYYDRHTSEFAGQHMSLVHVPGSTIPVASFTAENVSLEFGGVPVTLNELPVLSQPAGVEIDRYFGVLRQDALSQLHSYTFDFRTMRFTPRAQPDR